MEERVDHAHAPGSCEELIPKAQQAPGRHEKAQMHAAIATIAHVEQLPSAVSEHLDDHAHRLRARLDLHLLKGL